MEERVRREKESDERKGDRVDTLRQAWAEGDERQDAQGDQRHGERGRKHEVVGVAGVDGQGGDGRHERRVVDGRDGHVHAT